MRRRTFIAIMFLLLVAPCWGLTTLYVDPGGSAVPPHYLSLFLAHAALPNPLTDDYEIDCSGATDDNTAVTVSVATLNGGTQHTLLIKGDNTTGVFDGTKYNLEMIAVSTQGIDVTVPYITTRYLQVSGYTTGSDSYHGICIEADHCLVEKCIVRNFIRSNYSGIYIGAASTAWNNVCYGCDIGILGYAATCTLSHNTCVANTTDGFRINTAGGKTFHCYDNLLSGNGVDWHQVGTAGDVYTACNYTHDATSPNGAGYQSKTFTFIGGVDYHLGATENGKYGCTNPGAYGPTDDVDGQTRVNFTSGFDELVNPAAGAIPILQALE